MNEILVYVSFKYGVVRNSGTALVTGDFNSTKLVFEFDEQPEGELVFELKSPKNEVLKVENVEDNQIILAGTTAEGETCSLFTIPGKYIFELSLYNAGSKLTSATGYLTVNQEQVLVDGKVLEPLLPIMDKIMSDLQGKVDLDMVKSTLNDTNDEIPTSGAVKYYVDHSSGGITVDAEMSDTSENPAQNKVTKKYIDDQRLAYSEIADVDYTPIPKTFVEGELVTTYLGHRLGLVYNEQSPIIYQVDFVSDGTVVRSVELPAFSAAVVEEGLPAECIVLIDEGLTLVDNCHFADGSLIVTDDCSVMMDSIYDDNDQEIIYDSIWVHGFPTKAEIVHTIDPKFIANKSIDNLKLARDSVNTDNVMDNAITTDKVVDNAITLDKLQQDIGNQLVLVTNPTVYSVKLVKYGGKNVALDVLVNSTTSLNNIKDASTLPTANAVKLYVDSAKPTVDTAMSSSSTNLVQNKVIKSYVDNNDTATKSKIDSLIADLGVPTVEVGAVSLEGSSYYGRMAPAVGVNTYAKSFIFETEKSSTSIPVRVASDGDVSHFTLQPDYTVNYLSGTVSYQSGKTCTEMFDVEEVTYIDLINSYDCVVAFYDMLGQFISGNHSSSSTFTVPTTAKFARISMDSTLLNYDTSIRFVLRANYSLAGNRTYNNHIKLFAGTNSVIVTVPNATVLTSLTMRYSQDIRAYVDRQIENSLMIDEEELV